MERGDNQGRSCGPALAAETVEKAERLFRQRACGLMRADIGRILTNVHTFRPRSIFRHVHAPAENDVTLFRRCGGETLRGYFDMLNQGRSCGPALVVIDARSE